jgi:hypothetical protein
VRVLWISLLLWLTASAAMAADLPGQSVIDDWRRHDESRLRELVEPGMLRFPGEWVEWPGLRATAGEDIPLTSRPPSLDGGLSDSCWRSALAFPPLAPHEPAFKLCHDLERLYIAAELPVWASPMYRGNPTGMDAAGAVDGIKNGRYGFHTGGEPDPWWQVDLGSSMPLDRVVIYNRLDYAPGLHNANDIRVLLSVDGAAWDLAYEHDGSFFGGMDDTGPLTVDLGGTEARYVRLLVPTVGGVLFHLDEVEVYADGAPDTNVALHRPASQSSLSPWSTGGTNAGYLLRLGAMAVSLVDDEVRVNGQPHAESAVATTDERMSVEVALPLGEDAAGFPGTIALGAGGPRPVGLGAPWTIEWAESPPIGYGRNDLGLTLDANGQLTTPLRLEIEVIALTRDGLRREVAEALALDEPGPIPAPIRIDHEGAVAITLKATQGGFVREQSRAAFIPPVQRSLDRAHRLLLDAGRSRSDDFLALEARAEELAEEEMEAGPKPAERDALYLETRAAAREIALSSPEMDFDRLLFVKRFTQQPYPDVCLNHMPWVSRPGGDLCVLSPVEPDGQVRPIIDGQLGPGHVHGMDLHWDGERIVFAYAQSETEEPHPLWLNRAESYTLRKIIEPIHLFEIGVDGGSLRQLTDGEWSDLDPSYLPNGEVAFVSERCGYSLQCNEYDKDETSCNIYLRKTDGTIRRMSVTKDGDYLPHVLDNGLLGYTRWEYQERGWAHIQSLWVVRPDGTGADAVFKQHFNDPWAIEEVRSVPDSPLYVGIATGHHTLPVGPLVIVDPNRGINNPEGIRIVSPGAEPPIGEGSLTGAVVEQGGVRGKGGLYGNPWALSDTTFLVTYTYSDLMTDERGYALYLADVYGTRELIYRDPEISCSYPIPLRERPTPIRIADTVDPSAEYATCVVSSIYDNMPAVEPGAIKYLRISQRMAWPYTIEEGGHRFEPDVKSVMVNWTPARVLGTVPVREDGSAHFRVPADTPVYFQALDENMMEIRRMRSFISFQPGEQRSCVGCHETQARAPVNAPFPEAAAAEPTPLTPGPFGGEPVSFLRDIQPILDRNCVSCHDGLSPAGGLSLAGGLTGKNVAWDSIRAMNLVSRSNVGDDARITEPYAFGSTQSKLIEVLDTTHRDRVRLSEDERLSLITWIDLNGPYHGRFINKRPEVQPYDLTQDTELRQLVSETNARRCAECHSPAKVSGPEWIDLRDPAASGFLAAPLAPKAGGSGMCGQSIYASTDDPDYQRLLEAVEAAVAAAWARPRRDVATLE